IVSKYLGNGDDISVYSINELTKKTDCTKYIIDSVKLMIKVSSVINKRVLDNPKFEARLLAYQTIISRVFNLFMEPDIQQLIEPVKRLAIGNIISEALLLSSEQLGDLLIQYQQKVIEFQSILGQDDAKSASLHAELVLLCDQIFYQMRR